MTIERPAGQLQHSDDHIHVQRAVSAVRGSGLGLPTLVESRLKARNTVSETRIDEG